MIFGEIFLARAQCIIRSGQDSAVVPARLANHSTEFFLSCQTVELRSDERLWKWRHLRNVTNMRDLFSWSIIALWNLKNPIRRNFVYVANIFYQSLGPSLFPCSTVLIILHHKETKIDLSIFWIIMQQWFCTILSAVWRLRASFHVL